MTSTPVLRVATLGDVFELGRLIEASVRGLSVSYYSASQVASALKHIFGPDTALIGDRTYYVLDTAKELIAAGGWSKRRTLYGGDQMKTAEDPLLNPAVEPARIRAFFVHPGWARQGLGRRLFERCLEDAEAAGFSQLELMATLPGEPLYRALGFTELQRLTVSLPDHVELPVVRMGRAIAPRSVPPAI
jgi:GNAT superfamily N-acetyltransferase